MQQETTKSQDSDTELEATIIQMYQAYLNLTNPDYEAPEAEVLEQMIRQGSQDVYSVAGQNYKAFARWLFNNLKKYLRYCPYKFDTLFNILYYKDAVTEPENQDYYNFMHWLRIKLCREILKRR